MDDLQVDLRTTRSPHTTDAPPGETVAAIEFPDLAEWDALPSTRMMPEKCVLDCPYIGGISAKPRDIRTLRRWRECRRGPSYRKIGGRFFYEVGALREFFGRCQRGRLT